MTDGEKRAYGRGYNTGSSRAWPEHRPPHPPEHLVKDLMEAAQELRDAVDNELAMLGGDGEWEKKLGPGVDAVDQAMVDIGIWLRALNENTPARS